MRKLLTGSIVVAGMLSLAACTRHDADASANNAAEAVGNVVDEPLAENASDNGISAVDGAAALGNGAEPALTDGNDSGLIGNAADTGGNAS